MSPPSQLRASLHGAGGAATITGELTSAGLSPITFKAEGPFGVVDAEDGTRHWIDPEGRIVAELNVPRADLATLRPVFPKVRRLAGLLSGGISVTGTVSAPSLHGRLALSDGEFEVSPYLPVISKASGGLVIADGRAEIEEFTGALGAGSFELWGGMSLKRGLGSAIRYLLYRHPHRPRALALAATQGQRHSPRKWGLPRGTR